MKYEKRYDVEVFYGPNLKRLKSSVHNLSDAVQLCIGSESWFVEEIGTGYFSEDINYEGREVHFRQLQDGGTHKAKTIRY